MQNGVRKRYLESKSLVDQKNLNTSRSERALLKQQLVVAHRGTRGLEDLSREGAGSRNAPLHSTLVSLIDILDNLVGTNNNDNVLGTKGNTSNLRTGQITVGHSTGLGDGGHGGEEVVDGGADGAAELSLLCEILLGENGGTDVVVGGLSDDVVDESDLLMGLDGSGQR